MRSSFSPIALVALIPLTAADPASICADLAKALPGLVFTSADAPYQAEQKSYWNVGLWSYAPACVVLPDSAAAASAAVNILNANPGIDFAVKSGGHDPNPNHSATNGGVLISTSYLNSTVYDTDKNVAYVGPGQRWTNVIHALQPTYNVTVVGGRLGPIGVGGLLLGGGLSFLSAQYGLACDNIVEMETVLPNGTIANVNAASDPDLFRAMKGSGKNFGIVTKFTLKTYPIGQVWGGSKIYLGDTYQTKILTALHDFIENSTDPKAAIIVTKDRTLGGLLSFYQIFYFYDGPTPPQGVFKGLTELTATSDMTKVQSYSELLDLNGQGVNSTNKRASFRSITYPSIPNQSGTGFFGTIVSTWQTLSTSFSATHLDAVSSIAFQPLQRSLVNASTLSGGNAMGLAAGDQPRYVLEFSDLYSSTNGTTADDQVVYDLRTKVTATLTAQLKDYLNKNPQPVEGYNPFFLNDAAFNQDVLGSYKEAELFRSIQRRVDPNGLFGTRAGGFSY